MKRYRAVIVEWLDTNSQSEWSTLEGLPSPASCTSHGRLVVDEPDYVVLCGSIADGEDDDERFGDATAIPRGCIVRIRTVRERRSK